MFEKYTKCSICGHWHDDGSLINFNGHIYALCLDCIEDCSREEINEKLNELEI